MTNEPLQLNLGALRSVMSLTLHTHHASRIWHGRMAGDDRPAIIGLSAFLAVMSRMKRGAEQDDPYADWWMLRIEDKLAETRKLLQTLREQVDHVLARVPAAFTMGENLNVQPVTLPLFASAQLGFSAIYLLADFDELARKLLLAHHTALIDRSTLERWLNDGAHALRSLFTLAQKFRPSGATRADLAAGSPAGQAALERFGALPQEVIDGTWRSGFAPPLRRQATTAAPTAVNDPEGPGPGVAAAEVEDDPVQDEDKLP